MPDRVLPIILIDGNNLNVASPGACGVVSGYTLGCGPGGKAFGVPYPAFPFSTIANINDAGKSHYNSLQIKAETKSAKYGLYALIAYTYSRMLTTTASPMAWASLAGARPTSRCLDGRTSIGGYPRSISIKPSVPA